MRHKMADARPPESSDVKPTFDQIFRLTGTHLAAGALGFVAAVALFAPKPRVVVDDPVAREVLELQAHARAAASAGPGTELERAIAICRKRSWPACDADSVRKMGTP